LDEALGQRTLNKVGGKWPVLAEGLPTFLLGFAALVAHRLPSDPAERRGGASISPAPVEA
jgi:hypothetical protein